MTRKVRSDSKLNGLPREQRAKVDKWLFDKGMTYVEVAKACAGMFGLKVSRSSVARYYEQVTIRRMRESIEEIEQQKDAVAQQEWELKVEKMTVAERYECLMNEMLQMACEAVRAQEIEPDPMSAREVCRIVRVLISEQRRKNRAEMAQIERKRFELWAAKECLKEWRRREKEKQPKKGKGGWPPGYDDVPWYL